VNRNLRKGSTTSGRTKITCHDPRLKWHENPGQAWDAV
jgi:hypothetical protein